MTTRTKLMTGAIGSFGVTLACVLLVYVASRFASLLAEDGLGDVVAGALAGEGALGLVVQLVAIASGTGPRATLAEDLAAQGSVGAWVLLIGSVCACFGWLGQANLRGGTSSQAGLFALLSAIFVLILYTGLSVQSDGLVWAASSGVTVCLGLTCLFGGLGLFKHHLPLAKGASVALVAGGVALLLLFLLGLFKVDASGLVKVALYGGVGGLMLGHAAAGGVMLVDRKSTG